MASAISTRGLTKKYGDQRGIFDVDLDVADGEIFGFLGPNGAGKTTAIRVILDLIRPHAGTASVFGYDCRKQSRQVHEITGYLPGEFALDPKLTGRELLTYLGNLRGGLDWTYVNHVVERLGLDLDRRFSEYSRGNKQKVGIAQAFMHRPKLLILDEPTSGLDPLNQQTVLDLVREVHAEGATVFFSSHILSEVEAICHRLAFIRNGQIIRTGPVEELLRVASHAVEVEFARQPDVDALKALPSITNLHAEDHRATFLVEGSMSEVLEKLMPYGINRLISREPNLTEVFLQLYEGEVA